MRCVAPRSSPPVQAKAASSPPVAARQADIYRERPAALPAGLGTGRSLAEVPVRARPARAPGLPEPLKAGVERLSGLAMDDVRVHRDSAEPAKLGALAYTQGRDIYLGRGQERHLPHEAWHVVQQMQGRVRATEQMKGVGVNEDAGLEAEADQFAGGSMVGSGHPSESRPQPGPIVAQRKLRAGTREIADQEVESSPILTEMNQALAVYRLPDAWNDSTPASDTYVLDERRKYILGEYHPTSTFDVDTAKWKSVPKINEKYIEFPDRPEQYHPPGAAPNTRALESTHLHMLNSALVVHDNAILLAENFGKGGLNTALVDRTKYWIKEIGEVAKQYSLYVNDPAAASSTSPADPLVVDLEKSLGAQFLPALTALDDAILNAKYTRPVQIDARSQVFGSTALSRKKTPEFLAGDIRKKAQALVPLMEALTAITKIEPGSAEAQGIAQHSTTASFSDSETLGVLKENREQGMATKIKAVPPPSLVRLGDDHVEGVTKLVGDEAMPVRMDKKIDDVSSLDFWGGVGAVKALTPNPR